MGSEQDNVLVKTLVFSKLDCFYINMVCCVERFVLLCASLHYLMVDMGFCIGIVIWNKKPWSVQDNVLPKMLVFSKLDFFYINMVSCVERFVLFCASLHYLMVNMGFCMRIVIWNKNWG